MSSCLPHGTKRRQHACIALSLIGALSACAAGQDKFPPAKSAPKAGENAPKVTVANGETVSKLDKAIFHVFQAKNNDYWFGSDDRGVYRYNGQTLVNFTMKEGLTSNQIKGIQEDKAGNIYFTTYAGISKFNGSAFTTLSVSPSSAPTDWKLQPDDLWFVGPPDAGVVYRYDGQSLHRLELPKTKPAKIMSHSIRAPNSQTLNTVLTTFSAFSKTARVIFGSAQQSLVSVAMTGSPLHGYPKMNCVTVLLVLVRLSRTKMVGSGSVIHCIDTMSI